jgi:hypothetical protein
MPLLPTEQAIAAGSLNDVQYDLQTLTFNFSYRYYCGDPSVAAGTLIPMPFKLLQQWNPASEYRLFGMRYNLTASGGVRCTDFGWGVNNTPLKALLGVGFTDQAGAYTVPGVPGSIIMNESVASDANVGPTLTVNGIICRRNALGNTPHRVGKDDVEHDLACHRGCELANRAGRRRPDYEFRKDIAVAVTVKSGDRDEINDFLGDHRQGQACNGDRSKLRNGRYANQATKRIRPEDAPERIGTPARVGAGSALGNRQRVPGLV